VSKTLSQLSVAAPEYVASVRDEIAAVLDAHGHEAGQYAALGPDPWQVVWNDDRNGFIAFLEGRRCLVAWRSPVASLGDQAALLARLVDYAATIRKALFAIEVNESTRSAGLELGMTSIWTGYESFLDLATWSTAGGRRQKVRWARSHAQKIGVHWREALPVTNDVERHGLLRVEELWREERSERRTDSFLRTDLMELAEFRRYFVAEGPTGILAFVACTPVNKEAWYLQDIVRSPDAPRGALEGAMALALDTFRDEGFAYASNGPLPFWRPNDGSDESHQLGAIGNYVMKFFDRQYRFHGINQFRSKFESDWTSGLYVLRSRRVVTPGVARSLTKVLNKRLS
jgi:phosphatidylglycerol lysyltransferase